MKSKYITHNNLYFKVLVLLLLLSISNIACKKYLEAKPDIGIKVPNTLFDLDAILAHTVDMNTSAPPSLEQVADDYYLTDQAWNALNFISDRNLYIWEKDVFNEVSTPGDWSLCYVRVYRSNVVLEGLIDIERTTANSIDWDRIKGTALLYRAMSFLYVSQLWAKGYDKNAAKTDLGIPLRLNSNFNELSTRSSVADCYQKIVNDLQEAVSLLPTTTVNNFFPTKAAAYGYLARVYLLMQNYSLAEKNADLALSINNSLMDYNSLNAAAAFPFDKNNVEVIFNTAMGATANTNNGIIDTLLYQSYASKDLRNKLFFKPFAASIGGGFGFKGSYFGSLSLFNGIATNELYLISAECKAREARNQLALDYLNKLLVKRYQAGTFTPYSLLNTTDVLRLVLAERRKELLFRGLRWGDLKRLNKEPGFEKTLIRNLNGKRYVLQPNSATYALPIPQSVITISGMQQN